MAAKSTLTLGAISRDTTKWTGFSGPLTRKSLAGEDVEVLGAGELKVSSGKSGMLFLDGLTYLKENCHISITGNDTGEWTFFHLTVVGKEGKSAYFMLDLDDGEELVVKKTAHTIIDGKKKDVSKSEYYWAAPPANLVSDLSLLMRCMIGKNFLRGEA